MGVETLEPEERFDSVRAILRPADRLDLKKVLPRRQDQEGIRLASVEDPA